MTAAPQQTPSSLDHALALARYGFRVLPIRPGEKRPPMTAWQDAASAEARPIRAWFDGIYRKHGVGIATGHLADGAQFFVLDLDERDEFSGSDNLAALEEVHGKLPDTIISLTGSGSTHRFYRVPAGHETPRNDQAGKLGQGIDVRGEGGQVVVAPTIHPNGNPYAWESGHGPGQIDMAEAPAWLLDLLKPAPEPVEATPRDPLSGQRPRDALMQPTGPADRYNERTTWQEVLEADGWTLSHSRGGEDYWVRPGKTAREGISATVGWSGNDALKVFSSSVPWLEAERTYSRFQYFTARHHQGDERAAARRIMGDEELARGAAQTSVRPTQMTADDDDWGPVTPAPVLPEEFWERRQYLQHVRDAARARLVAPGAVLGAVLARVAAWTPPSTCLPPIVGAHAPLSLYVALHGASGDGKSSPAACAADLLPEVPGGCVGPLSLGSGEGLVEAYHTMVTEEDENGKKVQVKRQTFHGALFSLDEGQLLSEIGQRKGSTILPVLRTAWSGGDPGTANATMETRRHLKPHSYHVGLVSLWQTGTAQVLLGDADGGTPQRFIWLDVSDPGARMDGPEWPGALDWQPPAQIKMGSLLGLNPLHVASDIVEEVKAARVAHLHREAVSDPLDAHRFLNLLKLAGVLTVLDRRDAVTADDWDLAKVIIRASDATRDWIIAEGAREAALTRAGKVAFDVHRALAVSEAEVTTAVQRAAKAVYRAVVRLGDAVTHRDIARAIASRDRQHCTVDDAIAEAVRLQWIEASGDSWKVSQSKPAQTSAAK